VRDLMKTEKDIRKQLDLAVEDLRQIGRNIPVGSGAWRMRKGYIDALRWVLEEE